MRGQGPGAPGGGEGEICREEGKGQAKDLQFHNRICISTCYKEDGEEDEGKKHHYFSPEDVAEFGVDDEEAGDEVSGRGAEIGVRKPKEARKEQGGIFS